jgi:WD40 repeat protein
MQHDIEGESLRSTLLFNNRNYDFRDIYIDAASQLYAVSRSGHLVVKNAKGTVSLPLDGVVHPQAISLMTDSTLLVVGERSMAIYDPKRHAIVNTRLLDYRVTAVSRVDYMPLLFDDQGRMHAIKNINAYKSKRVPIDGQVSTYASSKNTHTEAYGMTDGTIYLVTSDGTVHKLIGHRSRISKMKINGHRLYSSSYDGTLCLWLTNSKKIEPMTLFNNDNWIMDFTFDNSKDYVWTANQNGTLTEALISVPKMVQKIKDGLKRDFTRKEWDYYIGENIPFESFTGKEVAP